MLNTLKTMQKQGVFEFNSFGKSLNEVIEKAQSLDGLSNCMKDVKRYITDLEKTLSISYNVSVGNTINDFYDKIYFELFEMYLAPCSAKTKLYQKKVSYGKAGDFILGLKSNKLDDVKFTLEERKLLKLINHYYIILAGQNRITDDYFYIPAKQLSIIFSPGINHKVVKDAIISNCERLRDKRVEWDFTKTTYMKRFTSKSLSQGKNIRLANIIPLYLPTGDKVQFMGIICKVNKFMKLRYELGQISSSFPTSILQGSYLEFIIAEKVVFHMRLSKNKRNGSFSKTLSDMANEIYYYTKKGQCYYSYLTALREDKHKPRELKKFLEAFTKVASAFKSNERLSINWHFVVKDLKVSLLYSVSPRNIDYVYNELSKIISASREVGIIKNFMHSYHDKASLVVMKASEDIACINTKKFYELLLKHDKNEITLDDVYNSLIEDLSYPNGNVLRSLELGQIQLKLIFK